MRSCSEAWLPRPLTCKQHCSLKLLSRRWGIFEIWCDSEGVETGLRSWCTSFWWKSLCRGRMTGVPGLGMQYSVSSDPSLSPETDSTFVKIVMTQMSWANHYAWNLKVWMSGNSSQERGGSVQLILRDWRGMGRSLGDLGKGVPCRMLAPAKAFQAPLGWAAADVAEPSLLHGYSDLDMTWSYQVAVRKRSEDVKIGNGKQGKGLTW